MLSWGPTPPLVRHRYVYMGSLEKDKAYLTAATLHWQVSLNRRSTSPCFSKPCKKITLQPPVGWWKNKNYRVTDRQADGLTFKSNEAKFTDWGALELPVPLFIGPALSNLTCRDFGGSWLATSLLSRLKHGMIVLVQKTAFICIDGHVK